MFNNTPTCNNYVPLTTRNRLIQSQSAMKQLIWLYCITVIHDDEVVSVEDMARRRVRDRWISTGWGPLHCQMMSSESIKQQREYLLIISTLQMIHKNNNITPIGCNVITNSPSLTTKSLYADTLFLTLNDVESETSTPDMNSQHVIRCLMHLCTAYGCSSSTK